MFHLGLFVEPVGAPPDAGAPVDLATPDGSADRGGRRNDRGSTSLTVALLTPLLVVLMFAAVQAALWAHARTEARAVARRTAALVARSEVSPSDATATALANLADDELVDVEVSVVINGPDVVVTVHGRAPGIIRGTGRDLSVTEAVPIEELVPR